jgi:hypothetical protein
LALTFAHAREGLTIGYDMAAWARQCACDGDDGPLTCPWIARSLQVWLLPGA